MPQLPSLLDLFKAGVHFGHQVSKRHPKMQPYIFTIKNGIHILNLELTLQKLQEALAFVAALASRGGVVLFVGTKQQAKPIIAKYASAVGMPYVTERWLGGTFTNFPEVSKVIHRFQELKRKRSSGELDKYTKKERLNFDREIARLERNVGGIEQLRKIADAVFVVDVRHEENAVAEAVRRHVPLVALCDTNVNPTPIAYPIPGNDDAIKAIELVTKLVADAITEGVALRQQQAAAREPVQAAADAPAAG